MYDSRRCGNPRISGVRVYPLRAGMDDRMGHVPKACAHIPGSSGERTGDVHVLFIVRTGAWLAWRSPPVQRGKGVMMRTTDRSPSLMAGGCVQKPR